MLNPPGLQSDFCLTMPCHFFFPRCVNSVYCGGLLFYRAFQLLIMSS